MDTGILHREATLVDTHNDLLLLIQRSQSAGDVGALKQEWIPELRAGGVDSSAPIYNRG